MTVARCLRPAAALLLAGILLLAGDVLTPTPPAAAHPLGNFTVNRYVRLEARAGELALRYVLDLAEIPAFQEVRAYDRNGDASLDGGEAEAYLDARLPALLRGLELTLNGRRAALTPVERSLAQPPGQGGLTTLRLQFDALTPLPEGWERGVLVALRDRNYDDRIGWREMVLRAAPGVALAGQDLPQQDLSAELTAYPAEQLTSPPDVRAVSFRLEAGDTARAPHSGAAAASGSPASEPRPDPFAGLVSRERLTPAFVILSLLAAVAWGAAHALGPGHGKTIVAAYLVGSRGTARHAVLLGAVVTLTHTSSVVALGLVTLFASRYLTAEDVYFWLSLISGALVVALGAGLFWVRLGAWRRARAHARAHRRQLAHAHGHDHGHGHGHIPEAPGLRGLIALGVSGGLLPCPTALVVMLGAITLGRVDFGLALVLAFSLGLAGVLTGIGLVLVWARGLLNSSVRLQRLAAWPIARLWLQAVPMLSAAGIFAAGMLLTGRALSAM